MPRAAAPNSWYGYPEEMLKAVKTCRTRKIRCDGTLPVCARCQKQGLFCDRASLLHVKQYKASALDPLATRGTPKELLQNPVIAYLFHIYIKQLAPWYDLNDSDDSSFGTKAVTAALGNSLLFSAVIAFAGSYAFRKSINKIPITISEAYHARCLELLIALSPHDETVSNGVGLAATCLLRSYEILAEKEDPNRHLFGASTLLPAMPNLHDRGLLPCGFWNYLREDITYSLIHECPLKVEIGPPRQRPQNDDEQANYMTLLLASIVNAYFGDMSVDALSSVDEWRTNSTIAPFFRCENGPFPTTRMLRDCHVAAMHYYHVAQCMLKPETCAVSAAEICGLAMSSESDAVVVNAYGPVCFSSKWLTEDTQRQALVAWLVSTQKRTAWPVEAIIEKLKRDWSQASEQLVSDR